jgi:plastocyanin
MKDKAFSPSPLKVQPGTKVTWNNADTALHTVTSGKGATADKMFDSKSLAPKKSFSFTFTKEGTFDYFCMLHPTMVGKVVVDKKAPAVKDAGAATPDKDAKPAASGKTVEIVKNATNKADKAFAPSPIKIKAGDTVTWKNADTALHTVTSGKGATADKMFDSKSLAPKKEFSFKFDKKGTFDYFCMLHPTMVGKVTVE